MPVMDGRFRFWLPDYTSVYLENCNVFSFLNKLLVTFLSMAHFLSPKYSWSCHTSVLMLPHHGEQHADERNSRQAVVAQELTERVKTSRQKLAQSCH